MCIGVFIVNRSCNGVVFNCELDVEKRQGMFCYIVSKLESWMEIIGVVDEILQGFKRKGCSIGELELQLEKWAKYGIQLHLYSS